MKALQILKCSDAHMWYNNHIGKIVPLLREYDEEFLSREPAGYTNIIKKQDAIVVDVDSSGVLYLNAYYGERYEGSNA